MASFSPPQVFNLFPSVPDGSIELSGTTTESKVYFFQDENFHLCQDTTIIKHTQQDLTDCKLEFVYFDEESGSVTITFNENKEEWGCPRIKETIVYDGVSRLHDHKGTKREGMKRLVAFLIAREDWTLSSNWKITFPDSIARDLGDALVACKNLKTLHLPDYESPEKRNMMERILAGSSSLEELHLETHWFPGKEECVSSELVTSLANGLKNNRSNLRTLNLQGCNLSDTGSARIVHSLLVRHDNRPSMLQHLNLMFNNFSERTMAKIGEMLRMPRCTLRTLNLSNQQRGRSGVLDLRPIVVSLPMNTSLKDLDISKNKITSSSLVSLTKAILHNNESCIQTLSMGSLSVMEEQNNIVGGAYSSSIHHHNHHHTNDGGGGGERCSFSVGMAIALRGITNTTTANSRALKSLDLSGNAMDPGALSALADVLAAKGCPIEHLNLDSCGITEEGVRSFTVPRLPQMEGLKTLELNLNPLMGARGVEVLLEEGLRHNTSLVSMDFYDCVQGGVCCLPPKAYYGCSFSVEQFLPEIRFCLALNKAGRRLLREPNTAPLSLKALVLERALKDKERGVGMVYYCLLQSFLI